MAKQLNVNMAINADVSQAQSALNTLQASLKKIASTPSVLFDDVSLKNASRAALELQQHLQNATNVNTGKLDLSRFSASLSASGKDLNYFKTNLMAIGDDGQQAFLHLAQSIALAEAPTTRVNKKLAEMGTVLKNTVRWQISSSIIHGFMGAVQQAWGYAQDLNESLNNIRIVTGHNTEQMAQFAKAANDAAKALNTTTTEYTDASLIYYQQGLNDKEVAERTETTIKLANVSRQSAEEVSDQMTAIWNNFYDGSESLEYYADVITSLGAHTASSSSEIAQGIQRFAAVAHTTGLSYEYATSALATLVATTRESADVVGTSLKTLFARVQGLKLGETLEDGVDLNKYSKALESVGVNILDQAGNLRDMDDILDDIGAKWDTMNRSQQTALAQTVAGVRQYNQFVALMDNWDFMKENLEIANQATGTLQEQADIYAQSWEAARDKVKAAAEGIYQALIDDSAIIDMTNGFAKLLDGVEGFANGLGGMEGLLSTVGSVFMMRFAKEIPQALTDLTSNINVFTGKAASDMERLQAENIQLLESFKGLKGGSSLQFDTQIEGISKVAKMTHSLTIAQNTMTAAEKEAYQQKIANVQATYQLVEALAAEAEALAKKAEAEEKSMLSSNAQSVMAMYDQYNAAMDNVSNLEQRLQADPNSSRIAEQLDKAREKAAELEQKLNDVQAILKLSADQADQLSNKGSNQNLIRNYQLLQNKIGEVSTQLKETIIAYTRLDTAITNIRDQSNVWSESATKIKDSAEKTAELKTNMSDYLELIEKTAQNNTFGFQLDQEAINKLNELKTLLGTAGVDAEQLTAKFKEFATAIGSSHSDALKDLDNTIVELQNNVIKLGGSNTASMEQFREDTAKAEEGLLKFETGARNAGKAADELAQHTVKLSEVVGQLSSALMSINAMINSLSRLSDVFNDKDATAIEKFGAVIGTVTTALMAYKSISTLAAKASLLFTQSQAPAAAAAAATGTAAGGAAGGVTALNAALSSGPIIIFTAAVMALAGAFVYFSKKVDDAKKKAKEYADEAREAADTAKEEADSARDVAEQYESAAAAYERAKESYAKGTISAEELKRAQDNLASAAEVASTAMDLQGASVAKLSGNYDALTEKVRQSYIEQIELAKQAEETAAKLARANLAQSMDSLLEGKKFDRTFDVSTRSVRGENHQEALDIVRDYVENSENDFLSLAETMSSGFMADTTTRLALNVEDFKNNPEKFLQAYEEVKTLYSTLIDQLTDAQINDNKVLLDGLKTFLDQGAEAYSQYETATRAIEEYETQLLMLQNQTQEKSIDSVDKYNEYRQQLIDQLAKQRGIAADDEEGMARAAAAVDKYLGNRDYLEPFQEIADAMRDIASTTGIAQEAIDEFYKSLTKEQQEHIGAATFNKGTTTEDWTRQIDTDIRRSQIDQLNAQKAAAGEGASLFSDKKATADDIRSWAKGFDFSTMAETMNLGEFNLTDFLMLSNEEQQEILQSYQHCLDLIMATEKSAEIQIEQSQLEAAQRRQQELEAQGAVEAQHKADLLRELLALQAQSDTELTEQQLTRQQELLDALAQMYVEEGQTIAEAKAELEGTDSETLEAEAEAQEALAGGYQAILAEIENLSAKTREYQSDLEFLALSAKSLAELNSMSLSQDEYSMGLMNLANQYENCTEEAKLYSQALRGNNEELKATAEDNLRASVYAAELGEACDVAAEDIENYADALKDSGKFANASSKALVEMAKDQARFDRAVESSIKNYDNWLEELKIGEKTGVVAASTMKELRSAYGDLLDIDGENFSSSFLKSAENLELMRQALEGSEEAYQQLQQMAGQEILAHIGLDTSQYFTDLNSVISAAEQATGQGWADIEAGASLNDEGFLQALTDIVNAAGMTAEQATDYLSSMGVDAEVVEQTETQPTTSVYTGATAHVMTQQIPGTDPLTGNPKTYQVPSIWYTANTTEVPGQEQITGFGLKVVSANKSSGGAVKAGGSAPLAGNGGSARPAPKGGGGGGGGSKEKEIKHADGKKDSEKERYHTLRNQLEDLSAAYDRVSKASDRAFGKDKLKLIDGEIKATDDLIKKQEEYIRAIQAYLPQDKAIMEAYAQKLLGFGIQYDASGNIQNFDALQDAMYATYNARAAAMDSESTEWQVFEKEFEELEHWIEQYEETYDLLRDEQDKMQELLDQKADAQLKKIQYAIELKLNIADDGLAVLEYQLENLEDKAFSAAESIALMGEKVDLLYDKVAADREGLDKILGQQLSSAEIRQFYDGDMSVLQGKHFTEEQVETIKEYRDNLLELNRELLDVRKAVQEEVMETFDEFNEKLEDQIDLFDHYNAILENYKNIIDIVGKSYLKVDRELLRTLNQATINNAINKVKGTKDAYDALVLSQQAAENALRDAIARGNEIDIEAWEKDLEEIQKRVNEAQEEMMQAWEDSLQSCAEMFELAVEDAIDNFEKAMLPFGSLEEFQDAYDKQKEVADQYLDDYDKIYELSKLARNVNNSINDAPNIAGKQKLAKLLEKINGYQEDGVQMSEYELEYLQKEYDLRLAEIALEEAQNAKSVVRLTRDNEGNYSYSYTADTSAVDDAAQKYEDALHAMQELSSNYIDDMSDQLIDATQQMEEELAAVRVQDYASIEDYYKKIDEIQQYWLDRMGYMQGEFQKALDNNKTLYEQDWQRYADATGYKISADEDFAKSYQDTVLGKLFDSEDDIIDFQERVNEALGTSDSGLIGELLQAYLDWQQNTENAMVAAGTSTEGFAEHMDNAVNGPDGIVDASNDAVDATRNLTDQMVSGFTTVIGAVDAWQSHYSKTMDDIIAKNMSVIEAHNLLVKALSNGDTTTSTSGSSSPGGSAYQQNTNSGGSSNSSAGSSGSIGGVGVTGTDGNNADLSKGSYVDVKSGTKWYADSWGGSPWGWARSGTIMYIAEGSPLAYNIEGLGWIKKSDIVGYDTGGYTGDWGVAGRLAMLHEKELVLNAEDTENFLSAIEMVRDISRMVDLQAQWQSTGLGSLIASAIKDTDQTLQQEVNIHAEFPSVTDHNEIEQAFNNLINTASQYANRKNPLSGLV